MPGLHEMRLLVALDALLRTGSVGGAAQSLGMQTSAMSRLLGELRDIYDDRIFIRTGRGMVPTPLAESLRQRVRALVAEGQSLILNRGADAGMIEGAAGDGWLGSTMVPMPPLAVTRTDRLVGSPSPANIAQKIASIDNSAEPYRRLAKCIAITAPGPGRSRPMTVEEARDALGIILRGEADPVQIGALLMTIQYRGVTAGELAGFVEAIRAGLNVPKNISAKPDLDWPAYVSANWRHAPWFIHAARLVAAAGYKVLLHGFFGKGAESGKLEMAASDAKIPVCISLSDCATALEEKNIAYIPLGAMAPQVQSLLGLYDLVETRTPIHAIPHLINPLSAPCTIMGAAQISKRDLYRDVARMLEAGNVTIVGSARDFAQMNPLKATPVYRLMGGRDTDIIVPALRTIPQAPTRTILSQREYWQAVWTGAARDPLAEATIIQTAAAALAGLAKDPSMPFEAAMDRASYLWSHRLQIA